VSPSGLGARFAAAHARLQTVAVTGTNGKTTTVSMVAAIVAAAGETPARLTTLGAWVGDDKIASERPTGEFLDTVEAAVARGARTLALEVTSKALAAGLARRWPPRIAVFTNLSRDHLDMHGSAERYLAAKAQLFMALGPGDVAVINGDDPSGRLIEEVLRPGVHVRRFSLRDPEAGLAATRVLPSRTGTRIELAPSPLADALGGALELSVLGTVHGSNAMAAALAADAASYPPAAIAAGLASFAGVPGRFQIVGRAPLVAVDYAHTPDGLAGTLATARQLVEDGGRLICVFGCGGDRDRGKRAPMGEIAHRLADLAVLTTDNPRFEDPATIAAMVRAGAEGPGAAWHLELDRPAAIRWAIAAAAPADVVVIAGKGHEAVQEIRGAEIPMSDVELAGAALGGADSCD
jgi:UDP-N-acetylmuramoyl-L-alanyl-D-glutamate--2,6-diaminopimelate ligase